MDLKDSWPAYMLLKIVTVSHICSLMFFPERVTIFAPNSTPIVTSCFCRNFLSRNWSSKQDFPTPNSQICYTSIANHNQLEHVCERHFWILFSKFIQKITIIYFLSNIQINSYNLLSFFAEGIKYIIHIFFSIITPFLQTLLFHNFEFYLFF